MGLTRYDPSLQVQVLEEADHDEGTHLLFGRGLFNRYQTTNEWNEHPIEILYYYYGQNKTETDNNNPLRYKSSIDILVSTSRIISQGGNQAFD